MFQNNMAFCHTMIWVCMALSFKAWREQQDINNSCSLIKHWWLCLEFYFKQKYLLNVFCNNKLTAKKLFIFPVGSEHGNGFSTGFINYFDGFVHSLGRLATKIWLYIHISSVSCIYQGTWYCVFSLPTNSSSSSTQNRNVAWVNFLKSKDVLKAKCTSN